MTWVGMDVYARSTPAAAINLLTGEVQPHSFRRRGGRSGGVVERASRPGVRVL